MKLNRLARLILIASLISGCVNNKDSSNISSSLSEISSTNSGSSSIVSSSEISSSSYSSDSSISSSIENKIDEKYYRLSGFADGYISSRENVTNGYVVVNNEIEFIKALADSKTKIIEITNDLNLGYYEMQTKASDSGINLADYKNVYLEAAKSLTHPLLMETGVGRVNIQDRNTSKNNKSLMIYSKNGITIKHAKIVVKRVEDLVIRNINFKELWEWDEKTKGNYDENDWDYITIEESSGVYLDHLTFDKSYDGLVDLKKGSKNVTISWSKFEFVRTDFLVQQFDYLENNRANYKMYDYLRKAGFTKEDLIQMNIPQKKGHLIGATELDSTNSDLSITLAHNYYVNLQDRLPRLRAGNAHVFNCILDSSEAYNIKLMLESKYETELNKASKDGYKVGIISQGIVTTENGAVYVENSIFKGVSSIIKNNQANPSNSLYTGKFEVVNSIYELGGYQFKGGSNDAKTPFTTNQAPIIPFSFNGFTTLPYSYEMIDVEDLLLITDYTGVTDSDFNWLKI
jgi:pectate lyase